MAAGDVTLIATAGGKPSAPTFTAEVNYEGPAQYLTGGMAIDLAAELPEGATIVGVTVEDRDLTGLVLVYDRVNEKLVAFTSNGNAPAVLAQVPNLGVQLAGSNFRLIVTAY